MMLNVTFGKQLYQTTTDPPTVGCTALLPAAPWSLVFPGTCRKQLHVEAGCGSCGAPCDHGSGTGTVGGIQCYPFKGKGGQELPAVATNIH